MSTCTLKANMTQPESDMRHRWRHRANMLCEMDITSHLLSIMDLNLTIACHHTVLYDKGEFGWVTLIAPCTDRLQYVLDLPMRDWSCCIHLSCLQIQKTTLIKTVDLPCRIWELIYHCQLVCPSLWCIHVSVHHCRPDWSCWTFRWDDQVDVTSLYLLLVTLKIPGLSRSSVFLPVPALFVCSKLHLKLRRCWCEEYFFVFVLCIHHVPCVFKGLRVTQIGQICMQTH